MKSSFYKLDGSSLVSISEVEAIAGRAQNKIWVDVLGKEQAELENWLDKLEIGGIARWMMLQSNSYAGIYPLKAECVITIPVLIPNDFNNRHIYVSCYLTENMLFTWHTDKLYDEAYFNQSLNSSDSWVEEGSVASILEGMLVDFSDACFKRASKMRDKLFSLQNRMDKNPELVDHDDIKILESRVLNCGLVISEQLPVLKALKDINRPYFKTQDSSSMTSCAFVMGQSGAGLVHWIEERLESLEKSLEFFQQEKTNNRLGLITILSAIFMPMTFLAGVWGMNFKNMPELDTPYGYALAIGAMVIIGLFMYLFFKRQGWIKKT